MIDRTSSGTAPWTIVESNDKYFCPDQGPADDLRTPGEGVEGRPDEGGPRSLRPGPRRRQGGKEAAGEESPEAKADSAKASKAQKAKDLRAEKAERRRRRSGESRQGKREGQPHGEMADDLSSAHFVAWFRSVAPYVNLFRGKTFLIAFGGKAIAGQLARTLAYDVNLLAALGVRLVLVHGARPQIESCCVNGGCRRSITATIA
jgi:hypothetical protein